MKITLVNFLKRIFGEKKIEVEVKSETVNLSNLSGWIKNKEKQDSEKEKQILILIKEKIDLLIKNLDEKLNILDNVDLESKKVENRIKLIVSGNLKSYIHNVRLIMRYLAGLKEEKLERFVDAIHKIFFDFQKNSDINYQKATFLVGEEMVNTKKVLLDFSKELTRILDKNKGIIESSKQISLVQTKLSQLNEIDIVVKGFNKKIKSLKEEIKDIENKIKKIEASSDYAVNIKKQQEIKLNEDELVKSIHQLHSMINFKSLSNAFHSSEKMMRVVKAHKANFKSSFQNDKGVNLLELLNEAKLNTEAINSKINQINDKEKELVKDRLMIKETSVLVSEVQKLKQQIVNLNAEIVEEEKRSEKIQNNKKSIVNQIKQELVKMNVVLS